MKKRNWVASFLASAFMTVLFTSAALAQGAVGTSSVTGIITDPQGGAVAGATVKLLGNQGTSRTAVTNDSGVYQFTSVQPGAYRLEVEANGFKKTNVSSFQALVDKPTEISVALEVGDVSATVNVDAGGLESIVNTQDASLGNNFVSQQILQLPLNARNVANLLSLQPAVTPDGSVAGGRSDQANITLDGVDVNNQQDASAFSPVLRVNPDSVDEFRVTTSNPDATKGRSSGAQISLITKSGSNDFHGALYWYHRNTITTANDWFNNAAGRFVATDALVIAGLAAIGDERAPRPQLIRNLYGGRIGGPILKDRLFFFYNYEALREAKGTPVSRTVPTASLAAGNIQFNDNLGNPWTITTAQINGFLLGAAPVVDVNPLVPTLFASSVSRYAPNDSTLGDGRNTSGFRFNAPAPVTQDGHTARIDWTVTGDQKHQVALRGNYQQDVTGVAPFFPDTPSTSTWSHPYGFAATHTWLINSNMTNRISYGLTRLAFSNQGDSADPAITFRFVFQPAGFGRAFNRTNPTQNITDDFTWINGNHTLQFGTNIRLITNTRVSFANSFDNGITNPSAFPSNLTRQPIEQYIRMVSGDATRTVAGTWSVNAQAALTALMGRLNGYGARFNFDVDGSLLPENTGVKREFKTEEYDWYLQDSWKIRPNLTLTMGLRYGLSMPVYETQGFETAPSIELSQYLANRMASMNAGINYREPLSVRLSGKVNGLDSMYPLDTNNFQPRASIAWSPDFTSGIMSKIFGKESESVFRAGFSITNDYFGQQLATQWDGQNTLGFSSSSAINVNTYNITTNPAPLYTGPGMSIRTLPNIIIPGSLTFPQTAPFTLSGNGKIEASLDQNLQSPINHSWNVSYGRRLPGKIWLDVAYVGRLARHLLAGRDVMMVNDIRDPITGMTYNQAATILEQQIQAGVPSSATVNNPFWDNMWAPGTIDDAIFGDQGWSNTRTARELKEAVGDWTFAMQFLSRAPLPNHFFQGQYDALNAFGTIGSSDYHAGTLSLRQRLQGVTWDFNYTFSKSLDNASGLQTSNLFFGRTSFILNAFNLDDSRAVSDFDFTHLINFNGVYDIPVGKGRYFGNNMNGVLDAFLGGWQLSGIVRYDSGNPFAGYFDETGWATNWQIRSFATSLRSVSAGSFRGVATAACTSGCDIPNMFADPDAAYASFRTPYPGETGTRNPFRFPGFINLDAGLAKSFNMPWKEGHKVTFRWDVFNVTNTPRFGGQSNPFIGFSDPSAAAAGNFGRYTGTTNNSRIMQFALRYDF